MSQYEKPDVYIAGCRNGTAAMLWKNGVAQSLSDGRQFCVAASVYVSGSDVYVVGWDDGTERMCVAKLWKNGVEQNLTDGKNDAEAYSVCVADGNVYVAGYENGVAMLWKNGVPQSLTDGNGAFALSVYVTDNNVYVVGRGGGGAKLWKNGIVQNLTDGASANSVYVKEGDVYVVGYGGGSAKLWKNGIVQNLPNGDEANSVYVEGNDVYVVGNGTSRCQGYPTSVAKLWKNGVIQNLTDDPFYHNGTSAQSVFVLNKNVYVVGHEYHNLDKQYVKLWINGVGQYVTKRYTNNERNYTEVSSVFVTFPASMSQNQILKIQEEEQKALRKAQEALANASQQQKQEVERKKRKVRQEQNRRIGCSGIIALAIIIGVIAAFVNGLGFVGVIGIPVAIIFIWQFSLNLKD